MYRRLGPLVALVDAHKARSGQTSGYVVVTTEFENRPWESYVPSRSNDAAVARELVRQIAQIHRAGVVHWDMFPKSVLFRPPCSVAIIDFEKAEFTTDRGARDADFLICVRFAQHENTRGIALGMLRAMPVSAAHGVLARLINSSGGH